MGLRFSLFWGYVLLVLGVGCPVFGVIAAELPEPALAPVSYLEDIHPLLAERCYACHAGGMAKGGFRMDTREEVIAGGDSGPVVLVGNSAGSRLIHLVTGSEPDTIMPPKGEPLTATEVGKLRAWIDRGLEWEEVAKPTGYKAPVALLEKPAPTLDNSSNPIDRWLAVYWEERGITPHSPVEDARFIRRVYLDIVGLLPDPETLDSFLQDTAPDKRVKLVDVLLDDRLGYAEHWMTFWNDHLRNDFEGTGYIDGGRRQITEWLFKALYDNKPFDSFARDLIAPRISSRGFIDGIVWRGVVPAAQRVPLQAASNVSQVFMGVNLKCASCHDSFIDDWKLTDAYGMANVFSEEALNVVRCEVDTGTKAEFSFLLPELGAIDAAASLDARRKRVAELTTIPENGYFTRTIINRIWARMMGHGLVMPLDTMDKTEPWHPELLDWLARDFIANGYDLKHTIKLIATSQAYQLPSVARNEQDTGEYVFTGPELKRLNAEEFYDALSHLTGVWQSNPKYNLPGEPVPEAEDAPREWPVRAWRVPADALMRTLGRPNREQVMTRRESLMTTLQALELSNGAPLSAFLERGAAHLLGNGAHAPEEITEVLFRKGLQRPPTPEENEIAEEIMGQEVTAEGLEDLLWTVAMLPEFQLIY